MDVERAVREVKAGKVEFRVDKTGIIHCPVGKVSFDAQKLAENASALISSVLKAKPSSAKGRYVRSIAVSSTMGPGLAIDLASVEAA
jgi:large subunit ribosomal protein L1